MNQEAGRRPVRKRFVIAALVSAVTAATATAPAASAQSVAPSGIHTLEWIDAPLSGDIARYSRCVSGRAAPIAEQDRSATSSCGSLWAFSLRFSPSQHSAVDALLRLKTGSPTDRRGGSGNSGLSIDLAVADAVRGSRAQEHGVVRVASTTFRRASIPGTLLLAATLYGLGEMQDRPELTDLGLNTGRAVVGAGAVTLVGKIAAGRARPGIAPRDPSDFSAGRGLRSDDYQAFPSAHTAAAFAAATVLAADLSDRHPGSGSWIYPSMYSAATMAGLSRIIDEEHWLTDTLAGALIGVLGGLYVNDRYSSDAGAIVH